jgi:hypothetical protein
MYRLRQGAYEALRARGRDVFGTCFGHPTGAEELLAATGEVRSVYRLLSTLPVGVQSFEESETGVAKTRRGSVLPGGLSNLQSEVISSLQIGDWSG